MPSFITWGVQKIKGLFAAIGRFFRGFFGWFNKKPTIYTYKVSSDDITTIITDLSHPKSYVAEMVYALKTVDPSDTEFMADLNRFDKFTFNSAQIYPDGRNALINDTLKEYALTREQMMPTLTYLTQKLPQAVLLVLHGIFANRHFLASNGNSELKINGSNISLTWDLHIHVTATEKITEQDVELRKAGPYQLALSTTVTIDLSKLTDHNAIVQTTTIQVLNKNLNLDLAAIDKKLHEEIIDRPSETTGTAPPLANTLTKKNLLTPGFSSLEQQTSEAPPKSPTPAPPENKI